MVERVIRVFQNYKKRVYKKPQANKLRLVKPYLSRVPVNVSPFSRSPEYCYHVIKSDCHKKEQVRRIGFITVVYIQKRLYLLQTKHKQKGQRYLFI